MKTTKITLIVLIAVLVATIAGLVFEVRGFFVNGTMINWSQFTSVFAALTIAFSAVSMKEKKADKKAIAK